MHKVKIVLGILVLGIVLSAGSTSASWFGGNDYYDDYGYNDWPEWTPMYWMEEMFDGGDWWGGDDYYDRGYGYGGGPWNSGGMPWSRGGSPFSFGSGNWGRNFGPGNYGSPYGGGYGAPYGGGYGAPYGGGYGAPYGGGYGDPYYGSGYPQGGYQY